MNTATKFRNHLCRTYGGKLIKSMGFSNPWAGWQTLDVDLPVENLNGLVADLKADGFVDDSAHLSEKVALTLIALRKGEIGLQISKKSGWTQVTGPKQAKKSYLPIYD